MLRRIVRFVLTLIGIILGVTLAWMSVPILAERGIELFKYQDIIIYFLFAIVFGLLSFTLSKKLIHYTVEFIKLIEHKLQEMPANDILFGVSGLIIGLLISYLVT